MATLCLGTATQSSLGCFNVSGSCLMLGLSQNPNTLYFLLSRLHECPWSSSATVWIQRLLLHKVELDIFILQQQCHLHLAHLFVLSCQSWLPEGGNCQPLLLALLCRYISSRSRTRCKMCSEGERERERGKRAPHSVVIHHSFFEYTCNSILWFFTFSCFLQ